MSIATRPGTDPATRKTAADYRAEADQLLASLIALDEPIDRARIEISRLKAETARLEAENRAVLSRLPTV